MINTIEKLKDAININKVPDSIGRYPGLIIINRPRKPIKSAVILCALITSLKIITAKIVVNKGVVKPNAVAFSRCIIPIAENQVIIDITLIKLRKNWSLIFFDFIALNLFLIINGKTIINPIKQRKKHIVNGFKSLDKYFTPEAISAAVKVPINVKATTMK